MLIGKVLSGTAEAALNFVQNQQRSRLLGELARELQEFVKARLAAYKYPREVEFVTAFPLTSSGKIRRDELRRREYERKGVPLPSKGVR